MVDNITTIITNKNTKDIFCKPVGLVLLGFLVCSALSTIVSSCSFSVGHCIWWRKPEDPEKTIDLPQVTDKLKTRRKPSTFHKSLTNFRYLQTFLKK